MSGWHPERRTEQTPPVRLTPTEKLAILDAAATLGQGETETIRRAIAAGLPIIAARAFEKQSMEIKPATRRAARVED